MMLEDLIMELNIDVNYSKINSSSVVSYESSTTDQFTVFGLEPNAVVTYTLQVISEVSGNFLNNLNNWYELYCNYNHHDVIT